MHTLCLYGSVSLVENFSYRSYGLPANDHEKRFPQERIFGNLAEFWAKISYYLNNLRKTSKCKPLVVGGAIIFCCFGRKEGIRRAVLSLLLTCFCVFKNGVIVSVRRMFAGSHFIIDMWYMSEYPVA